MLSKKSSLLLKVLLNKYHQGPITPSMLDILPDEAAKQLHESPVDTSEISGIFTSPEEEIEKIHYSWIFSALKSFPPHLQPHICNCLPKQQSTGIAQMNQAMAPKKGSRSDKVRQYLLSNLYKKIDGADEVIPESFIQQQPLSQLLDVQRNVLLETIDLLGLYDLALNLKHIVDKSKLERITRCLSAPKRKFLRMLLHRPDRVKMPKLDLSSWNGDSAKLNKILHRRGLHRLAKALSGYPEDFMWHFYHRLDTGRASIIKKYYTEEASPVSKILTEQVLFIMNALTQKSSS